MVDFLALDEWGSALRWTLLAQNEAEDDESLKRITVLESVGRVRRHAAEARVFSAVFKWVPEDYYDRPLAAQAELLGCAESQMCKSMIMENTSLPEGCSAEEEKLRYVMVVVQYAAKFNAAKLAAAIRASPARAPAQGRPPLPPGARGRGERHGGVPAQCRQPAGPEDGDLRGGGRGHRTAPLAVCWMGAGT